MDLGVKDWIKEFLDSNFGKKDSLLVSAVITIAFWLIYLLLPQSFISFVGQWINEFVNRLPQAVYLVILIATGTISWIWIRALKHQVKSLRESLELSRVKSDNQEKEGKLTPANVAHIFDATGDSRFQYQFSFPRNMDLQVNVGRISHEIRCKPCGIPLEIETQYQNFQSYTFWKCPACGTQIYKAQEKTLAAKTKSAFIKAYSSAPG